MVENNNITTTSVDESESIVAMKKEFDVLLNNLGAFKSQITAQQNRVKGIEKLVRKEMRSLERKINKNKNKGSFIGSLLDLLFLLKFQPNCVNL